MSVLCLVIVISFSTLCPSSFVTILMGKERAACVTLIVFLVSCDCKCSVSLLHGAVGWSAVCDCGNS